MLRYLIKKALGSSNDRIVKTLGVTVKAINDLESVVQGLDDAALAHQTVLFKKRLQEGESLDLILPEAFATVREVSRRVLSMRHFDVQLIGGIVLHKGKIAEMKTGEGKTLVATAPVYLNALTGRGVHVVTVNDYLARRDSAWMGKIYEFLGLSVSCITNDLLDEERKNAYKCDVIYGTNNEFGFDYLRDNLKHEADELVQRGFNYAIVDEVDSILIDEARTPLIISGAVSNQSKLYKQIQVAVGMLQADDVEIDEKSKSVNLTEKGHYTAEDILKKLNVIDHNADLYAVQNMSIIHHLNQALKAQIIFKKDVDYIVKDKKVMIIDEFTGRIMDGRRYSEGLHQAIEAKESVEIQSENQTLASVTFQNYFRMYTKLSGMTGTAMTEANEFADIYGLEVLAIPTHCVVQRIDEEDVIYKTAEEKNEAIVREIKEAHAKGQPVLVGTVSIEKSESLSLMLKKEKIKHNVLNARYHEQEAHIIAQAGRAGAITIATNMAGRGTDIMLGGNAKLMVSDYKNKKDNASEIDAIADKHQVLENGGLLVIGTERHESRRIDNQLRGRSGRQGDPGRTKFFLSLEDDLMRMFGSEKISGMLTKLGLKKGEAIVHSWISRSIEKAQQRVEARNYEIRKNLLKFDDVINEQRKIIYAQRSEFMSSSQLVEILRSMMPGVNLSTVALYIPKKAYKEEWDVDGLEKALHRIYGVEFGVDIRSEIDKDECDEHTIVELLNTRSCLVIQEKAENYGDDVFNIVLKNIFLQSLDQLWRDHLYSLDNLRGGISLRAYAQKDPLSEYKIEAFSMFNTMLDALNELIVSRCMQFHIVVDNSERRDVQRSGDEDKKDHTMTKKVPRNSMCECGSGKKYKHCHGKI